MPKVKKVDFPNVGIDESINAMTSLIEKLNGETKNGDAFATMIGHTSGKSGTFLVKLGDLRKYGLLEPRGDIKATVLAKKIVHPLNEQEKQISINKMIMNVELWRLLYQKIGKNYPTDEQFWVYIMEVTNCDRSEAIKEADKIRKKYKEVMSYYKEVDGQSDETSAQSTQQVNKSEQANKPITLNENMIEAKAGNVYVTMPKDSKSIEIAKKLIDILSMQIEESDNGTK